MGKKHQDETLDVSSLDIPIIPTLNHILSIKSNTTIKPTKLSQSSHKWSNQQTQYFYQLLEKYGTDFSIMSANYINNSSRIRTKKELLNKFKKQEKTNQHKITTIFDKAWKGKTFKQNTDNLLESIQTI